MKSLEERVAAPGKWMRNHAEVHRVEAEALSPACEGMERHREGMNDVRLRLERNDLSVSIPFSKGA
jgi:hypothetical protein